MKIKEDRERECLTAEVLFQLNLSDLEEIKREQLKKIEEYKPKKDTAEHELDAVELIERIHRNPGFIPRWAWECDEYEDNYHFMRIKEK